MLRFLTLVICSPLVANVTALYLTWYGDPTTTMTIHWHTPRYNNNDTIYLQDSDSWQPIIGSHAPLNYLFVHTVHLSHLKPDYEYQFRIGETSKIYKFRTAPARPPIRFVIGGDADFSTKIFRQMNQTIVEKDPLFCVIGGDVAYAVNIGSFDFSFLAFHRWMSFLSIWKEQMITPNGRIIPLVLGIGNHDFTEKTAAIFFTLFPFPDKQLYRALDFTDYLSLILLDTEHIEPIMGKQTAWLASTLANRRDVPYRFAIYHEGAYPSYYPYDGIIPQKIRSSWCPLFDQYQLTAAFENHNHTFKRTHPLKNNAVDPKGVVYFGDGCWGAIPRKTNDMWYLEKRGKNNNVYLIDIKQSEAHIQAIDLFGDSLDSLKISP